MKSLRRLQLSSMSSSMFGNLLELFKEDKISKIKQCVPNLLTIGFNKWHFFDSFSWKHWQTRVVKAKPAPNKFDRTKAQSSRESEESL
mmetsp:Transcript_9408/g.10564  ORF Transcript_9408/g.10564 Transcript_9408/m.10564 type:complete len:88 (-) Transcript_9408:72-335(-)